MNSREILNTNKNILIITAEFVVVILLMLFIAHTDYTGTFIDSCLSFIGMVPLGFYYFVYYFIVGIYVITIIAMIVINKFKNMKKLILPIILAIIFPKAIIPLGNYIDQYYMNNNLFTVIKYRSDDVQNVNNLVHAITADWKNYEGRSPLAVALIQRKYVIADYLVKKGASVDISDQLKVKSEETGEVVLDYGEDEDIQKFLKEHRNNK